MAGTRRRATTWPNTPLPRTAPDLGRGLTAEARTEWTAAQAAHGLELLQDVGGGVSLQAVLAQSNGADLSGRRWGLAVAGTAVDGLAWRLAYAAADRNYRVVTGATELREGLRLGTTMAMGRSATAEVGYVRTTAWDAAPDSSMVLATHLDLARSARLSLDMALADGTQAPWRAGVSFTVPLEALGGGR